MSVFDGYRNLQAAREALAGEQGFEERVRAAYVHLEQIRPATDLPREMAFEFTGVTATLALYLEGNLLMGPALDAIIDLERLMWERQSAGASR